MAPDFACKTKRKRKKRKKKLKHTRIKFLLIFQVVGTIKLILGFSRAENEYIGKLFSAKKSKNFIFFNQKSEKLKRQN